MCMSKSPHYFLKHHCTLIGVPDRVEEFIIALDLGSTGHHITSDLYFIFGLLPFNRTLPRQYRSICENARVCQSISSPHGKNIHIGEIILEQQ